MDLIVFEVVEYGVVGGLWVVGGDGVFVDVVVLRVVIESFGIIGDVIGVGVPVDGAGWGVVVIGVLKHFVVVDFEDGGLFVLVGVVDFVGEDDYQ